MLQNANYSSFTSNKKSLEQLTGCKKPKNVIAQSILFGNPIKLAKDAKKYKADMKNYRACLDNYKNKVEATKDAVAKAEVAKLEAEEKVNQLQEEAGKSGQLFSEVDTSKEDTFLGMPKTTGIVVVSVFGAILLTGLGLLVYRNYKMNN